MMPWKKLQIASLGAFFLGVILGIFLSDYINIKPILGLDIRNTPEFSQASFRDEEKHKPQSRSVFSTKETGYVEQAIDISRIFEDYSKGRMSETRMRMELYNFGLNASLNEATILINRLVEQGIPSDLYICLIEGKLEQNLVDGAKLISDLTKSDNITAIPKDILRLSAATHLKLLSEERTNDAANLAKGLEKFQITPGILAKWSVAFDIQNLGFREFSKIFASSLSLSTDDLLQVASDIAKRRGFDALKEVAELRIHDSVNADETRISRDAANLAEANPLNAWLWVSDLPSGSKRGLAANGVIATIANKTPDRAIDLVANFNGSHDDRINLLLGLRVGFEQRGDSELVEQVSALIKSEETAFGKDSQSN